MLKAGSKRLYETTSVSPVETGMGIMLDNRVLKSPAGQPFAVPTEALAQAIADEWAAQGDHVDPGTMPLTQLGFTGTDRIAPERDAIISELVKYGGSDLICYRADAPQDLVAAQEAAWDPLVAWAREHHGLSLMTTSGILHVSQPAENIPRLIQILSALDVWQLTVTGAVTPLSGSLVIALAMLDGRLKSDVAFDASMVDELHQVALWGEDEEARRRREGIKRDLDGAGCFLALLEA